MLTIKSYKRIIIILAGALVIFLCVLALGVFKKVDNKANFKSKLPYYTEEYTVVFSKNTQEYYINVLKEPYIENAQKAKDWIIENGENPENLYVKYTPQNKLKDFK